MQKFLMIFTGLLLAGCTTMQSRPDAMSDLNKQFTGHKADAFFLSYGKAIGKPETVDHSKIYHWISIAATIPNPSEHMHNFAAPGGKHYGFNDSPGVVTEEQYCRIDIYTNKKNIIQKLVFINDTPGKWGNSRCAEIFGTPKPE